MGDRGNIVVLQNEGRDQVWFYTHWNGYRIKEAVQDALNRGKDRWQDEAYLARIVFDSLRGDDDGTTGYGISCRLQDNEHDIVVVDMPRQCVFEIPKSELNAEGRIPLNFTPPKTTPFQDFAAIQLPVAE